MKPEFSQTEKRAYQTIPRSLLDSTQEGIFSVDLEGKCIFANKACIELFGYVDESELLGVKLHPVIHHSCKDGTEYSEDDCKVYQSFRCKEDIYIDSEVFWKKDGTSFPVEYHASPIFENNKLIGSVVTFSDITERKKAESILKASKAILENQVRERTQHLEAANQQLQKQISQNAITQAQLRQESEFNSALLNTSGALIVVLNRFGEIIRFNRTCEEVTGYSYVEVASKTIWNIFTPPDEKESIKKLFGNQGANELPKSVTSYWLTRKGEKRLISWSNAAIYNDKNEIDFIISTGIDITDQKKIEDALKKSEATYRTLASNLPGIAYRTYLDTPTPRTVFLNENLEKVLGYNENDLLGHNICECESFILEEDLPRVINELNNANSNNSPYSIEYRAKHKDGHIVYLLDRGKPYSEDGKVEFIDGVIMDISERKLMEQNDRKRMLELAHVARLSTMGEMATEIAHELNQPLSAIMTFSDAGLNIVKSKELDTDALLSALNGIASQAQRAGDIIKGLRNFVGKQETHATTTDINSMIHSVMKLTEVEARSHDVLLEYDLDKSLPLIITEKILIEQVILNLIRNSIEALSSTQGRKRKIRISSKLNQDNMIEISVEDTGTGLSRKDPGKIFEAFNTSKANGMGMGLTICRRIIEAHGGKITARNNQPYGAIVSFTLPSKKTKLEYYE